MLKYTVQQNVNIEYLCTSSVASFGAAKHSLFWFDDATMDWSGDLSDRNLFFCLKILLDIKIIHFFSFQDFFNPLMDIVISSNTFQF